MGLPLTVWQDDAEYPAELTVWDGSAEVTPLSLSAMPYGYSSVSEMLAQPKFYVAHRGGSADWPEGSLHAYTQSVAWGAPALEFSLGRSSDGVYFQLHDQYLDRTSLGTTTTTLNPALMTWDQINTYTINQYGRQEPYCKLTDALDAYLDSHVFFIDPKYTKDFLPDLWDLLSEYPGYEDKIVLKYAGGDVSVADEAHAHGCKAWGFYYPTDNLTNMVNLSGPYWDLIGMQVNSDGTYDSSAWTQALSLGKPVVGHICSSKTMSDGAFAAGASGVMVSGVKSVMVTPKVFENKKISTGALLPSDILLPSNTLLPSDGNGESEALLPNEALLPGLTQLVQG
jgi:hypothetical protein